MDSYPQEHIVQTEHSVAETAMGDILELSPASRRVALVQLHKFIFEQLAELNRADDETKAAEAIANGRPVFETPEILS